MPYKPQAHNRAKVQANRSEYERQRGTAQQRGYTARWNRYSRARLLEHPLCVLCLEEGKEVLAQCTDHIKPASEYPELFWEPTNHRSLCYSHNAKCAKQS